MTAITRSALDSYKSKRCNIPTEARERARRLGNESMKRAAADGYAGILPTIQELRAEGLSFRAVAAVLNESGFRTRNGAAFAAAQVHRIIERAAAAAEE